MKIVSWNIERGYRPREICRFLADLKADVYLLTELDRGNRRTANVDMFQLIQEALGLPGHFALEFEEKESVWRGIIGSGGHGGGVHGNAVLARPPIQNYRIIQLPTEAPLRWDGSTLVPELFEPRRGGRVAQLFELTVEDRTISVVNTHLENWRCGWDLRRKQLDTALAEAKAPETILAGDLNCLGGILATLGGFSPVNREVHFLRRYLGEKGLFDPWSDMDYTNFNYATRSKLDWLCVSSGLEVIKKENLRTGISDHNCLSAHVRFKS